MDTDCEKTDNNVRGLCIGGPLNGREVWRQKSEAFYTVEPPEMRIMREPMTKKQAKEATEFKRHEYTFHKVALLGEDITLWLHETISAQQAIEKLMHMGARALSDRSAMCGQKAQNNMQRQVM